MDEALYNKLVSEVFQRLLKATEDVDPDVIESGTNGDMVVFTSGRGEKCIVSTQRAVRQIWVAGRGQGIHFSFDDAAQQWRDDKGKGLELYSFVSAVLVEIGGESLRLPAL
jgi:CyaY protein